MIDKTCSDWLLNIHDYYLTFDENKKQTVRPSTPPEDANKEMTEAEREKIGSYEEAFEKIKEETGVSSMVVSSEIK